MKRLAGLLVCLSLMLTGCEYGESLGQDISQKVTGLTFTVDGFDNYGEQTFSAHGESIRIDDNKRTVYEDGEFKSKETSVLTVTIDGKEIESCGDTLIFYQDDLVPDYDFYNQTTGEGEVFLNDSTNDSGNLALSSYYINRYKNLFGKSRIVVIKSQMGRPIYAFAGDSVYWDVSDKLPKCTKLSIDGKALYIHRANYQIIDTQLLN